MRIVFVCLITIVFFSCSGDDQIPGDVLPQKKMQQVMFDLMHADELALYRKSLDTSFKMFDSSKVWYQAIYQLNKTDENEFKRSMHFYESHPDLLQPILDSLQRRAQSVSLPNKEKLHSL